MTRSLATVVAVLMLLAPGLQTAWACCPLLAEAAQSAQPAVLSEMPPCHEGMQATKAAPQLPTDGGCAHAFDCCQLLAGLHPRLELADLPGWPTAAPESGLVHDLEGHSARMLRPPSRG